MALAGLFMLSACAAPSNTPPRAGNTPVQTQSLCGPRDSLVEYFEGEWREAPVAHGLTDANDTLVELFVSKDGRTWTLLLTHVNGQSCVIVAGHDWRGALDKLLKPMGQPI